MSVNDPSAAVVVDNDGSFVRLIFTPAIPAVFPAFVTIPDNETVAAETHHAPQNIRVIRVDVRAIFSSCVKNI